MQWFNVPEASLDNLVVVNFTFQNARLSEVSLPKATAGQLAAAKGDIAGIVANVSAVGQDAVTVIIGPSAESADVVSVQASITTTSLRGEEILLAVSALGAPELAANPAASFLCGGSSGGAAASLLQNFQALAPNASCQQLLTWKEMRSHAQASAAQASPLLSRIRWLDKPTKCVTVHDGQGEGDRGLALEDCSESKSVMQQFLLPRSGSGSIAWADDPKLCVLTATDTEDDDEPTDGQPLMLRMCSSGNAAMPVSGLQFRLPPTGHGAIASENDEERQCLGVDTGGQGAGIAGGSINEGLYLFKNCTVKDARFGFIIDEAVRKEPAQLRFESKSTLCADARDSVEVNLAQCDLTASSQLFDFPKSGRGPIRLQADLKKCLEVERFSYADSTEVDVHVSPGDTVVLKKGTTHFVSAGDGVGTASAPFALARQATAASHVQLLRAPHWYEGCRFGEKCWTPVGGSSCSSAALLSGDVVALYFPAVAQAADCAGAVCAPQRYPVEEGHWGGAMKVCKNEECNAEAGEIADGDKVWFQRLYRSYHFKELGNDTRYVDAPEDPAAAADTAFLGGFRGPLGAWPPATCGDGCFTVVKVKPSSFSSEAAKTPAGPSVARPRLRVATCQEGSILQSFELPSLKKSAAGRLSWLASGGDTCVAVDPEAMTLILKNCSEASDAEALFNVPKAVDYEPLPEATSVIPAPAPQPAIYRDCYELYPDHQKVRCSFGPGPIGLEFAEDVVSSVSDAEATRMDTMQVEVGWKAQMVNHEPFSMQALQEVANGTDDYTLTFSKGEAPTGSADTTGGLLQASSPTVASRAKDNSRLHRSSDGRPPTRGRPTYAGRGGRRGC
eukprot:TRINITY_DN29426_c0_g1_i2.p1 TRINITY_DN29426_c0_g1~~TRINITY_DN29426_c0_g1_i2.p1  ORF type:complete len:845 (+),score=204.64 TRINITY_DN29426_c0_g1_i2:128-2662(+)